jgi:ElaB/YqjD/DUF883 family membrane-anchored ribosome-binding protein
MAIDGVRNASEQARDTVNQAADVGEDLMGKGYETAREYADTGIDYVGDLSQRVGEFVKRDPWIAVAGAFVIGYLAAQLLRRMR